MVNVEPVIERVEEIQKARLRGESLEIYKAHQEIHEVKQPRKHRVLLAVSGSVAAVKFEQLCLSFAEWAEVKAVCTQSSQRFLGMLNMHKDIILYTDDDDWSSWKIIGDDVLHIELRKWADIMVIAPLSANTLAKIAGGLCDNLLTCIVRAWDYSKPFFVSPAMNTHMWNNPLTEQHMDTICKLGIRVLPPMTDETSIRSFVIQSIEGPRVNVGSL